MPVVYFLFWIVLNGRITVEVIVTGVVTAFLASLLFYRFIGLDSATEKKVFRKIVAINVYLGALVAEVFKANIQIFKIILSPEVITNPQIKYFDSPVRSDLAKIALAYTICLTPGTIVVELEGNRFGVHTIDAKMLDWVEDSWHMVEKLKDIEGGHGHV